MNLYQENRNGNITHPHLNSNIMLNSDWKQIYSSPHRVALDTKSRKFQCKLFKRCLATNVLLSKIRIISSPGCTFCREADESIEHIFLQPAITLRNSGKKL